MPAFTIVEAEVVGDSLPASATVSYKHIVHPMALAVHADAVTCRLQNAGEGRTGELGTLIRVEDLRVTIAADGSLQRLHTEVRIHRVGYPPGQDLATVTDVLEYSRKLSELKVNHCKMKIIELVKHMENL